MALPLAGIGLGLQAAGLAGSIFGKKKVPKYNTAAVKQLVEAGSEEQRRQIARLQPGTAAQLKSFETGVNESQAGAKTAREAERSRYLSELDPVTSKLLQSQTDQLKRTTFGAIPEAQQATREALAASGGLSRGVSAESLAKVPLQAAQQFSEGAASLQQQSLQEQQRALANLHSEESQAIAKDLGIDTDTYQTILNTGNAALINELNALIEESQRRTSGLVSAETGAQLGNIAAASADAQNQQAIFQALAGAGGSLAGLSRPQGVEEVAPAQRKRRNVISAFDRAGTANA